MEFQHPDLRQYSATFLASESPAELEQPEAEASVFQLMAMIDHFRIAEWDAGGSFPSREELSWEPKSPELVELFALLVAPEQRDGLKSWCETTKNLNPSASAFRDWITARINEPPKPN
jgi:hypothetical protein